MKKKIKYSNGPINKIEKIPDFLPSPEMLALKEENVKVTISLSRASVEFFKKEAKQNHAPYQKLIRRLLDEYASHQNKFHSIS